MSIHRTALIDKNAEIGEANTIGPYVVLEGHVKIGDNNTIGPGTIITGNTVIGSENFIHGHVYIGNTPQDISYNGSDTKVIIGNKNILREFTNIHRGTKKGTATVIGDNNYFMVSSHIAHNCKIGNNIFMVNGASLGGYCEVHDYAFLSAYVIVHQFVRVGSYSICGILTKVTQDILPFMMIDGNPARVIGLNLIGLKRNGFSAERRQVIKKAYTLIYRSGLCIKKSLAELKRYLNDPSESQSEDLQVLIDFIENSQRGLLLRSPKNVKRID